MTPLSLEPFNGPNLIIKKCSFVRKEPIHFNKWTIKLKIAITHCLLVLCTVHSTMSVTVHREILSASLV